MKVTPDATHCGGTPVLIHGVDPARVVAVSFGGAYATDVRNERGALACVTPLHVAACVDVTIVDADGEEAVLRGGFTYLPPDHDRSKAK